jgi:N-(2-amino-2-carboxyethyl)-L-glutamate synthase
LDHIQPFAIDTHYLNKVGNTPLIPIELRIRNRSRTIWLKLEGHNPGGSCKDRTALSLIASLEQNHKLPEGSVVVESTSGNLGIGLSWICNAKGYKFLAVIDPKLTLENRQRLERLGAQLEQVDRADRAGGYLITRLERVRELLATSGKYLWTNQYSNPANPLAHYRTTGPEIYEQTDGKADAVFVPVSTGGTIAGIGAFFRKKKLSAQIIGVDAVGSMVFSNTSGRRHLPGIGSSRKSEFLTPNLYDHHLLVSDGRAIAFCRLLDEVYGLKLGGSSGAAVAACAEYLTNFPDAEYPVCMCPDRGENYESSIYDEAWIKGHRIDVDYKTAERFFPTSSRPVMPVDLKYDCII